MQLPDTVTAGMATAHGRTLAQTIGLVLGPAIAAALLIADAEGWKLDPSRDRLNAMAAVAALMAVWWLTEAVPLAVTALLPLVLFPLLKIPPYSDVAFQYGREILFLFLGGFLIALGIEESGLHRRVALHVLALVGDRPRQIVLGFMLATAVLSMWISNTATTLMMLPIAVSVLAQVDRNEANRAMARPFGIALLLSVAYSASIGGIATLIGTPPNLMFLDFYQRYAPGETVSFAGWMALAMPFSVVMLLFAWLLLTRVLFPVGAERLLGGKSVVREQLRGLGPISSAEFRMAIIFAVTALLWVTREPLEGWGWGPAFGTLNEETGMRISLAKDSTVAIFMAVLCFIVPRGGGDRQTLVTWDLTPRIPWAIILLYGGGFALGTGLMETGLDVYLGNRLAEQMGGLSPTARVGLVTTAMTFFTELTSNMASVTMILPILGETARQLEMPVWDLMVPATLAASCAFMLPIATAPNAIVYSTGRIRMWDMIRAGFLLNILGVVLVVLWMQVV